MVKLNLSVHEATKGTKIIYLYRRESQKASDDAWNVMYTTENEKSISVDSDTTKTKSGSIRTPSQPEVEVTGTSLLEAGSDRIDEIENACLNTELMEIWEANLTRPCYTETYTKTTDVALVEGKTYYTRQNTAQPDVPYIYTPVANPSVSDIGNYYECERTANGKYKGRYYQGYITEFTNSSNAEDYCELSLTFGINGKGKAGDVTVDADTIDDADYVFTDTPKTGA